MQFTKIALASAALLAVASQAQAAVRISGATATSNNYVIALTKMCAGENVNVFKTNTSTNSLGNQFTVKCNSGNFIGADGIDSGENEAQFDITGGSINSVLFTQEAADNGEPLAASGKFLPAGVSCTTVTGTGPLAFLGNKLRASCPSSALVTAKSVGGFTDVEPPVFTATGVLSSQYTYTPATFSQVFGVAVSKALYEALQAAQGLTVGSTTPANQPSISRAKLASLMNNIDFNQAKAQGPKFLVPGTTQTNITYCRRPNTSGTQASAQLYFMADPVATGALGGKLGIHAPNLDGAANIVVQGVSFDANGNEVPTGNTVTFVMNSGSSNVRSCLNAAGFSFGVLSAENNPLGGSDTYRFVKVSNVSMTGGVAGDSQTATALSGDFDFVYEAALFNPQGVPLLDLINASVLSGAPTPGLFLNSFSGAPETKFGRGGNAVSPYVAY